MENQTAETLAPNNAHTHLIDTFTEITSSSREEALFFLESHNFDLDSAVSTFLETTTAAVDAVPVAAVREGSLSPSSSPSRSRSPSPPPPLRPQPNSQYNLRSRRERKSSGDKKASGSRAGGIHTISNLNRTAEDDSGSDSDEPQEYYTGGEKSGMLVQDPSKANDIDALFDQARRAGGVEGHGDHLQPSSSSRSFSGTARLLSGETISTAPSHPETVTHNITFWSNGFTVDDGPLRQLDDPENASFLESIKNSECPQELVPEDRRTVVHVNLMRKEQDCPVPQKCHNSFQGRGRTLGGGEDAVPPVEPIALSNLHSAPPPSIGLVVDQALPSTSIQLRLADGTRMVSRFNYHHTIRDIRGFIDASRHVAPRSYQLQTVGFPPKQLNNMEQTIEEAGLANSVVIQKL